MCLWLIRLGDLFSMTKNVLLKMWLITFNIFLTSRSHSPSSLNHLIYPSLLLKTERLLFQSYILYCAIFNNNSETIILHCHQRFNKSSLDAQSYISPAASHRCENPNFLPPTTLSQYLY